MDHHAIDVDAVARGLSEFWSQHVLFEANGDLFKVAKGIDSTIWHRHDDLDEVFLVTSGEMIVQFRDGEVRVGPGQLIVVPRGVEHCPRADDVVHFLIIGPQVTSNTAGGKPAWSATSMDPMG
jgi:mannose-6-phosphate isomerase-like protein (cupin superfamily)